MRAAYDKAGADEVVFLDITASSDATVERLWTWFAKWRRKFLSHLPLVEVSAR